MGRDFAENTYSLLSPAKAFPGWGWEGPCYLYAVSSADLQAEDLTWGTPAQELLESGAG